jgi:hypothetical protein
MICPMFMREGTPSGLRTMSTGRPVRQERHVLFGQDLGHDALVAVAAGHLVALHHLALLGDVDAHQLVDARLQLVAGQPVELRAAQIAVGLVGRLEKLYSCLQSSSGT